MTKRGKLARILCRWDCRGATEKDCSAESCEFWTDELPLVDRILDALMEPDADFDVAITKLEMEHSRADIKVLRGREVLRAILTHIKEGR